MKHQKLHEQHLCGHLQNPSRTSLKQQRISRLHICQQWQQFPSKHLRHCGLQTALRPPQLHADDEEEQKKKIYA